MNKEFNKVVSEFIPDLLECFPEYKEKIHPGISAIVKNFHAESKDAEDFEICIDDEEREQMNLVYEQTKQVIPERFFDILYKNEEMFSKSDEENKDVHKETERKNNNFNTEFLIGIDFEKLWNHDDMTEKTQEIIWKYLQLFLFSIVSDMKDGNMFGDTAKLFEAINENEFRTKLEETMEEMQSFFENIERNENENNTSTESETSDETNNRKSNHENGSSFKKEDLPDPEKIHEHIQSMMGGKIGCLAKEIAEETMQDIDLGLDIKEGDEMNPDKLFKQLFKDPSKLMKITKNIGGKLESKIKNGDIKEEELMQEASEMMTKMKEMPGMDQFNDIIKAFGGNMGKMNKKASNNAMSQKMQQMSMRERMQDILKQRQANREQANPSQPSKDDPLLLSNEPTPSKGTLEGEGKNQVFKVSDPDCVKEKSKRPNKKKKGKGKKKGKNK